MDIEERTINIGHYIIDKKATVKRRSRREKSVLACYFPLIVRKKMQIYASISAFFMTSLRRKIPNPKLLCTTKISILSAVQDKNPHNPDGL